MDLNLPRLAAVAALVLVVTTADADQTRDQWVTWHRTRALRLEAEGRHPDAVEEWVAVSRLLPGDADAAARAAVAMVEVVMDPAAAAEPTDPAFQTAEGMVREAARRGALFDPSLAYAIGRLRLADKDYGTALRMFEFARLHGYEPIRTRFWDYRAAAFRSREMLLTGGATEAVFLLERCLRESPGHPDESAVRIFLGNAYRAKGDLDRAIATLVQIVKDSPWAARAHLSLGDAYAARAMWAEASEEYNIARARALANDDGFFTGREVLKETVFAQAKLELARNDLVRCAEIAKYYLELAKDAPEGLNLLAVLRIKSGTPEDLREAARLLRQARRLVELRRGAPIEILERLHEVLGTLGETAERDEVAKELAKYRPPKAPPAPVPPGSGK